MMQKRALSGLLGAVLTLGVFAACGTSTHPPGAELRDESDRDAGNGGVPGDSSSPPTCIDYSRREGAPDAACSCRYDYGSSLTIDIPCGAGLCSAGKLEAALCDGSGHLTVQPIPSIASCPDAGGSSLPPCDGGLPETGSGDSAIDAPTD